MRSRGGDGVLLLTEQRSRLQKLASAEGLDPGTSGHSIDVGTKAATMLLAAEALHLAAEPVTSFSRVAAARLLDLADGVEPRLIVCLGHRGDHQPPAMGRWAEEIGTR